VAGCYSFIRLTEIVLFGTDGRRPVYLIVLPIFVIGSLGVSLAHSARQLMLWRVVQAFGGGGGMSVGAGVISDIYRLEERGAAMGFFFAVSYDRWRNRDVEELTRRTSASACTSYI